jgi:hypothetical protein
VTDSTAVLDALPTWMWDVPYVAASHPGAVPREAWRDGANCQLFAYGVLALHGWAVTDLRSDELWFDKECTTVATEAAPLDLVLFQKDQEPYGAHVGLVVAEDAVLHLCKEVGLPVVWGWDEFATRLRYRVVIGYKRPTRRLENRPSVPLRHSGH